MNTKGEIIMAIFRLDGSLDDVVFDLPNGFEAIEDVSDEGKVMHCIKSEKSYDDEGEETYEFSINVSIGNLEDGQTFLEYVGEHEEKSSNATFVRVTGSSDIVLVSILNTQYIFGMEFKLVTTTFFVKLSSTQYLAGVNIKTFIGEDVINNDETYSNILKILSNLKINGKKIKISDTEQKRIISKLSECLIEYEFKEDEELVKEITAEDLPENVYMTDGEYVTINNDWAIKLPKNWVYSSDENQNGNRPFAAMDSLEYDDYGLGYAANCFVVYRFDDDPDMILAGNMVSVMFGREEEEIFDHGDIKVTVSYNEEDCTTRGQNVVVTTSKGRYTIQYFYTNENQTVNQRHNAMEKILKTICLVDEIPTENKEKKSLAKKSESSTVKMSSVQSTYKPTAPVTPLSSFKVNLKNGIFGFVGAEKDIVVPEGITHLGGGVFMGSNIESIVLPEGLKKVDSLDFTSCDKLKTVVLPSTLKEIPAQCFYCERLKDIYISKGTKKIHENAFGFLKYKLVIHTAEGSVADKFAQAHGFKVKYDYDVGPSSSKNTANSAKKAEAKSGPKASKKKDTTVNPLTDFEIFGETTLVKYNRRKSNVIIPDGITKIDSFAFDECKTIKNITIPSTVVEIGKYAFSCCTKLESITLPKNITTIDEYAFSDCFNLNNVVIDASIEKISNSMFHCCTSLKTITIPNTVTEISSSAFYGCEQLEIIIIPDNVISIGSLAIPRQTVICGSKGSFAEKFAKENGYKFELLDDANKKEPNVEGQKQEVSKPKTSAIKVSVSKDAELIQQSYYIAKVKVSQATIDKIRMLISEGEITKAIEETSNASGLDLDSSKLFVENFDNLDLSQPQRPPVERKKYSMNNDEENQYANHQSTPTQATTEEKKSGCYVATAVYGSYDCPEVWTLRRFRDYCLASTFLGRMFIILYYAISPTLVEWFGETKWFKKMWKSTLDKMVEKLEQKGYESTPYEDKNY